MMMMMMMMLRLDSPHISSDISLWLSVSRNSTSFFFYFVPSLEQEAGSRQFSDADNTETQIHLLIWYVFCGAVTEKMTDDGLDEFIGLRIKSVIV
jgi:hypothetical protein